MPETIIPEHGREIWATFWQLSVHRAERQRISPTTMKDWLTLHARTMDVQEIKAIEAMDRQFLLTLGEEIEHNESRRKG